MGLSHDQTERLVFIKYLLSQAERQKDLERPLCSSSILTLHDCVECFLQLCFEVTTGQNRLSSKNILDSYAEEINKILYSKHQQTINKSFIKRINNLRNQLKHATIFTDPKQIPKLYDETDLFLHDFTLQLFSTDFTEISLVQLVNNSEIKNYLTKSESLINEAHFQKAMWYIAKALYIIEENVNKIDGKYGKHYLMDFFEVDYLMKYEAQIGGSQPGSILSENLVAIAEDINRIQLEIDYLKRVASLGINFAEYTWLKQNLPFVSKIIKADNGKVEFWIPDEENKKKVEYDKKTVQRCLMLVLDLALKLN